jgi:hypothetical protein
MIRTLLPGTRSGSLRGSALTIQPGKTGADCGKGRNARNVAQLLQAIRCSSRRIGARGPQTTASFGLCLFSGKIFPLLWLMSGRSGISWEGTHVLCGVPHPLIRVPSGERG